MEALPAGMVHETKKPSTHTTYIYWLKTKNNDKLLGDGRGDQGNDFEIGHIHLALLLDRSFKLQHTLWNTMSIPGYWASA